MLNIQARFFRTSSAICSKHPIHTKDVRSQIKPSNDVFVSSIIKFGENINQFYGRIAKDDGDGFYPARHNEKALQEYLLLCKAIFKKYNVSTIVPNTEIQKLNAIPQGQSMILMLNHSDPLDTYLLGMILEKLNRPAHIMSTTHNLMPKSGKKNEEFNEKGFILQGIGCYSYDKGNKSNSYKTSAYTLKVIQQGKDAIILFPEGMITFNFNHINPLHTGMANLALKALKPNTNELAPEKVWIIPVLFVTKLSEQPLKYISDELSNMSQKVSIEENKIPDNLSSSQHILKQIHELLEFFIIGYQNRCPEITILPNQSLDNKSQYVLQNIISRLGEKYHVKLENNNPERLIFGIDNIYEKIKNRISQDKYDADLEQDLSDARFAKCLYLFPKNLLNNVNTIESNKIKPETFYQALMLLRYYSLKGKVSEILPIPRTVTLKIGQPIDVQKWENVKNNKQALTTEIWQQMEETLINEHTEKSHER